MIFYGKLSFVHLVQFVQPFEQVEQTEQVNYLMLKPALQPFHKQ